MTGNAALARIAAAGRFDDGLVPERKTAAAARAQSYGGELSRLKMRLSRMAAAMIKLSAAAREDRLRSATSATADADSDTPLARSGLGTDIWFTPMPDTLSSGAVPP